MRSKTNTSCTCGRADAVALGQSPCHSSRRLRKGNSRSQPRGESSRFEQGEVLAMGVEHPLNRLLVDNKVHMVQSPRSGRDRSTGGTQRSSTSCPACARSSITCTWRKGPANQHSPQVREIISRKMVILPKSSVMMMNPTTSKENDMC